MKSHVMWNSMPQQIVNDISKVQLLNETPDNMLVTVEVFKPADTYIERLTFTESILNEIYTFLSSHYTNHDSKILVYSKKLLTFFFNSGETSILLALRKKDTNDMIGFISGVYKNIRCKTIQKFCYVDFLCIHKDYRSTYIAAYLITQLWTYVQKTPAIFHTFRNLPRAICKQHIYVRPLNLEKLVKDNCFEIPHGFSKKTYCEELEKIFSLVRPKSPYSITRCNPSDVHQVCDKLNEFNKRKFVIYPLIKHETIMEIIQNTDFMTFKLTNEHNSIIAYMDVYILTTYQNSIECKNAYMYNTFHSCDWSEKEVGDFLIKVLIKLRDDGIDIITIQSHIDTHLQLQKFMIKGSISTHIFNHSMIQLQSENNGLVPF